MSNCCNSVIFERSLQTPAWLVKKMQTDNGKVHCNTIFLHRTENTAIGMPDKLHASG
jgi:hypothetical protein